MRAFMVFCLIMAALTPPAAAQGCPNGILLQKGQVLEYHTYKKTRKKVTYKARHQVIEVEQLPDRQLVHLRCGFYKPNNDLIRSFGYFIGCKDEKMILDKEVLSDPDNLVLFEDKTFTFEGRNIHYPPMPEPNDTLRSAGHTVEITTGSIAIATIATSIYDRKVLGRQQITTPAGTFYCYRIGYVHMLTRSSPRNITINQRQRMIEYVVPGLGVVRSERVNKKGKIRGYTQLVSLQQPPQ